jgi:hypothetical protein
MLFARAFNPPRHHVNRTALFPLIHDEARARTRSRESGKYQGIFCKTCGPNQARLDAPQSLTGLQGKRRGIGAVFQDKRENDREQDDEQNSLFHIGIVTLRIFKSITDDATSSGNGLFVADDYRQVFGIRDDADAHRLGAAADVDVLPG